MIPVVFFAMEEENKRYHFRITTVCVQGLETLQDRGLSHGNLHIGNILIRSNCYPKQLLRDGSAVLSCPTGFLLGVQSRHRTQALGLKGITSLASLDAYCLGHILYEVGSC